MIRIQNLILLVAIFFFHACNSSMDKETYAKYQKQGNEISNLAQATLLANVGQAIQTGGPEYAVEFCNLEASGIVDSLNLVYQCEISRVSDKNRNPQNALTTDIDQKLWQVFKDNPISDTVIQAGPSVMYFKRINTAMPACLKCHGVPGNEISEATMDKLHELYPNDLATGYQLNDFRGLWKIRFDRE